MMQPQESDLVISRYDRKSTAFNSILEINLAVKNAIVTGGTSRNGWAATAPELDGAGGLYRKDNDPGLPSTLDLTRGSGVLPLALDPDTAARLWALSKELVRAR